MSNAIDYGSESGGQCLINGGALRGADAYIAGEGDQEGNWKFGVLSMRGELLLNIEYDTISAPAPDLLAAEADRVITLFALTEEKAYQVYSITLD